MIPIYTIFHAILVPVHVIRFVVSIGYSISYAISHVTISDPVANTIFLRVVYSESVGVFMVQSVHAVRVAVGVAIFVAIVIAIKLSVFTLGQRMNPFEPRGCWFFGIQHQLKKIYTAMLERKQII
jgi:hypothetical protein